LPTRGYGNSWRNAYRDATVITDTDSDGISAFANA
jgi:hypothetical protein